MLGGVSCLHDICSHLRSSSSLPLPLLRLSPVLPDPARLSSWLQGVVVTWPLGSAAKGKPLLHWEGLVVSLRRLLRHTGLAEAGGPTPLTSPSAPQLLLLLLLLLVLLPFLSNISGSTDIRAAVCPAPDDSVKIKENNKLYNENRTSYGEEGMTAPTSFTCSSSCSLLCSCSCCCR